jgi:tetratricopeptide (TPR) repeat protein
MLIKQMAVQISRGSVKVFHGLDFFRYDQFFPLYLRNIYAERFREINELLFVAERLVRSGAIGAAILAMREATHLLPHDPKLFNMFAAIFFYGSRYGEMAECLTCAIGLAPKNPYLRIHRAWAQARLGDFQEAREDAWDALRLSEKRVAELAYCFYQAGMIELLDKKYMAAAICLQRTAMTDPLSVNYGKCMELARVLRRKHESASEEKPVIIAP